MGRNNIQKEPKLSDWINYLIHIRNIGYSVIGIILTISVIYFGYITFESNKFLNLIGLQISILILLEALVYLIFFDSSPLVKSQKLLNLIMKRELNDIGEIENLWYKRRGNMYKKIIEFIKTHWIEIIGIVILLIGIILFIIFCDTDWCEIGKILIPTGIAILASGIAISSDKKLKESQFIEFRRLRGQFEDVRLSIRERKLLLQGLIPEKEKPKSKESKEILDEIKTKEVNEYSIKYSFGIWRCKTYIDEINTIKKILSDKDQKSIIRLLALYYAELLDGRAMLSTDKKVYPIGDQYIGHLQQMYDIVTKFDVFEKIKDKKLGKRLLEAKDMIMNDVIDLEEIKKLNDI